MGRVSSDQLDRALGYTFTDAGLYKLALTHRSHGASNNERLEFLGDSIVNFVIAEALFARFPEAREGQLSRLRASLVKGPTLAQIAIDLQLGEHLQLGLGELKSGGHKRESILADALEAIIGGIYLDGGLEVCRDCILGWFAERLCAIEPGVAEKDAKTCLQEWLQARRQPLPKYHLEEIQGEAHEQLFKVSCRVGVLQQPGYGEGRSRRIAEQQAARVVLDTLHRGV